MGQSVLSQYTPVSTYLIISYTNFNAIIYGTRQALKLLCNFNTRRHECKSPEHYELHNPNFKYISKYYFIFLIFNCQL